MIDKAYLQSHALFGGLTEQALDHIIPLLDEVSFDAGTVIYRQGTDGDRLFFILDGTVEILKEIENVDVPTEPELLATLGAGSTFGEMELIDIQPRSATVRALTPLRVLVLTNGDLYAIYKKSVKVFALIVMNIAREISRRLRRAHTLYANALYHEDHPDSPLLPPDTSL
jgi:CRP/FNR family cyclic AMP-dependent transcriptional regulator